MTNLCARLEEAYSTYTSTLDILEDEDSSEPKVREEVFKYLHLLPNDYYAFSWFMLNYGDTLLPEERKELISIAETVWNDETINNWFFPDDDMDDLMPDECTDADFENILAQLLEHCKNNRNLLKYSEIDGFFLSANLTDKQIHRLYSAIVKNDITLLPFEGAQNENY